MVDDDTASCVLTTRAKSLKTMKKSPCTEFQQIQVKVIKNEEKAGFSVSDSFDRMLQSPTILEYVINILIISALNHQFLLNLKYAKVET